MGLPNAPPEWRRYLDKHNVLGTFTADLVIAAHASGTAYSLTRGFALARTHRDSRAPPGLCLRT